MAVSEKHGLSLALSSGACGGGGEDDPGDAQELQDSVLSLQTVILMPMLMAIVEAQASAAALSGKQTFCCPEHITQDIMDIAPV